MATVQNGAYGAAAPSLYPGESYAQNRDIVTGVEQRSIQPLQNSEDLRNYLEQQSSTFDNSNAAPSANFCSPSMNNWPQGGISRGPISRGGRARSLSPALQQQRQQLADDNYLRRNYQPTWVDTIEEIYSSEPRPQHWNDQQQQQHHQSQSHYQVAQLQPQQQQVFAAFSQRAWPVGGGDAAACEHHQQNCIHSSDSQNGHYRKQVRQSASLSPQKNYQFTYQTSHEPQKQSNQFEKIHQYQHQNQPNSANQLRANHEQIGGAAAHLATDSYSADTAAGVYNTKYEIAHQPQINRSQQQSQHFTTTNQQHERLLMPFKACDKCQNCPCHMQNFGLNSFRPQPTQPAQPQLKQLSPPPPPPTKETNPGKVEFRTHSPQKIHQKQQFSPPQQQQKISSEQAIFNVGQNVVPQQVHFQQELQESQQQQQQPQQQQQQQQQQPSPQQQTFNSQEQLHKNVQKPVYSAQQQQNRSQPGGHSIGYYQMVKQQNAQSQRSPISPPTKPKPQQQQNSEKYQPPAQITHYEAQQNYHQTQQIQQQPQFTERKIDEFQQQQNFTQDQHIQPQQQSYTQEQYYQHPKSQTQQQPQPIFKQSTPPAQPHQHKSEYYLQQAQTQQPRQNNIMVAYQNMPPLQQYYMEQEEVYVPQKQQKQPHEQQQQPLQQLQIKEQQQQPLQFNEQQQQQQPFYKQQEQTRFEEHEYQPRQHEKEFAQQQQQNYQYDERYYQQQQQPIQNYQHEQRNFQSTQQQQQQPKVPPYIRKQQMFSPRSEYSAVGDEVGIPSGPPPTFTTKFGDNNEQNKISYRLLSRRSKSEDPRRHHSPVPGASDQGYLYGGMDFTAHDGRLVFRPDDFELPGENEHKRKSREELPLRRPGDHYGLDFSAHPAAAAADASGNDAENYHGYAPRAPRQHWKFSADPDAPLNNFEVAMLDTVDPLTLVGDTLSNQKIAAEPELTEEEKRQFCVEFAPPTGFRPEHRTVLPAPAEPEPICMSLSAKKDKIPHTSTPAAQSQEQHLSRSGNPFSSTQDASWYTNGNKELMRNEPNWSRNIVLRKQAWEKDAFKDGGPRQPAWARAGKVQPAQPQQQDSQHGEPQRMTSSAHWVNQKHEQEQQQRQQPVASQQQQVQQQYNQQQTKAQQLNQQQQQRYPQHPQQQYAQQWQVEQQRIQQNPNNVDVDIVVEDAEEEQHEHQRINQQQHQTKQQVWANAPQQFQAKQHQQHPRQIDQQNQYRPQQQQTTQQQHYQQQQTKHQVPQQNTTVEYYQSNPSYGNDPNQQYKITRTTTTTKGSLQPQQQNIFQQLQPQYFISKQQYKEQQPATVVRTTTTTRTVSNGGSFIPEQHTHQQQQQKVTKISSQQQPTTIRQQIGQNEFVS